MQSVCVSALNTYVKSLLDGNEFLRDITVHGEIGEFRCHRASGHCYFTIKDEDGSSIRAIMFAKEAQRLSFSPEAGMQVLARGRVSLYKKDATFNFYTEVLVLNGEGALMAAFLKMKEKLEKEGLFDSEYKKHLPATPNRIGLVTSKDGAAVHDIISVAKRRAYMDTLFVLYDVPVQGARAAQPIAKAIKALDDSGEVDVIIVTRGGGSTEDLFVFNSEVIARAIFSCKTPIISAVGHESDIVISDLVADMRAATPTAASEIVLPDKSYVLRRLEAAKNALSISSAYRRLDSYKMTLKSVSAELDRAVEEKCVNSRKKLLHLTQRLAPYDPENIMKKGYSIIKRTSPGAKYNRGEDIEIETSSAYLFCNIKDIKEKNGGYVEKEE